jgi:maltose O-acetyltransferase
MIFKKYLSNKIQILLRRFLATHLPGIEKDNLILANDLNKKMLKKCGKDVIFNGKITLMEPEKILIEDNVHIGENSFLHGKGCITIKENTHIGRNFLVFSSNHNYKGDLLPYDDKHLIKPVVIGKNVWIGANVSIIPGVSIGDGAIIGTGTIVNKDVPDLAIIGAGDFKIIKYRDQSHYHDLENNKKYSGASGKKIKE